MDEITSNTFSIDALLQVAKIPTDKAPSIKAFLEWANVDQATIDCLTEESLEKFVAKYNNKKDKDFELGFYAGKIVEAAAIWTKGKCKGKKRFENELEDLVEKRKRTEQLEQEEPKFTVNGEIKNPLGLFFLEPKESNQKLLQGIERGEYIMLQGHRGSGKTTRCIYAILHQLIQYTCLWITLQGGINTNTVEEFWESFGTRFMAKAKTQELESSVVVNSSTTFMKFFMEQHEKGKRIVLFLDEFDLLLDKKALDSLQTRQNSFDNHNLHSPESTPLDSLLNALRGMKSDRFSHGNQPALYALQSCVIIGPLSILQAANTRLSPFNVSESLQSPYFSEDDVKLLFKQFQDKTGKRLDNGIVEDVFYRTRGHPGLTCYCGKRIHEDLAYGKSFVSLQEWKEFALFRLPKDVPYAWPTIGRVQNVISQPSIADFLVDKFLHTDKPVQLDTKEDVATAIFLTAEGALARISDTPSTFNIPSPLIRALILHAVSSQRKSKILENLPIEGGSLNVAAVLQYGLPFFDSGVMQRALTQSCKKNQTNGADAGSGGPVPEECCYQVELTFLLRRWLPDLWRIDTEVNAGSKSCDIVVTSPKNGRFALELVAHERDGPRTRHGSVEEHFQRCKIEYKGTLGADEAWVINFTTRTPAGQDSGYVWPSANDGIRAAHIWHDLTWKNAKIVLDSDKNTPIQIKLQQ